MSDDFLLLFNKFLLSIGKTFIISKSLPTITIIINEELVFSVDKKNEKINESTTLLIIFNEH